MSTLKRVARIVAATVVTVGIFAGTSMAAESAVAKPAPGVAVPMDTGW